jgi:hypothetical protein
LERQRDRKQRKRDKTHKLKERARWRDRKTERHKDGETERQIDGKTERQIDEET